LRRLVKQGVVISDRVGNAFAYRLNRDHLAAEHIVGLARLSETLFSRLEKRLAEWEIPPHYAAIFGSAARGSMTADSDVDLLLVRPSGGDEGMWDVQVGALVAEMTRWLGNDVRPLEFTVDEVDSRGRDEPVLRAVVDEGVTVAGSHSWLVGRLRKEIR
jgi:predicted nucleotidyltransferase